MLDVHFYKVIKRTQQDLVLVGESFENSHRMPYDVEIENDVNVIAI